MIRYLQNYAKTAKLCEKLHNFAGTTRQQFDYTCEYNVMDYEIYSSF